MLNKDANTAICSGAARFTDCKCLINFVFSLLYAVCLVQVYESEGLDEMALGCYLDARKYGDDLHFGHPDKALPYSNLAAVCYHLNRFDLALQLYGKALTIREQALKQEIRECCSILM